MKWEASPARPSGQFLFPANGIVSGAATKTIWFTRNEFGCIRCPSGKSKRKSLESLLPPVGRAKTDFVPNKNMEEYYEK